MIDATMAGAAGLTFWDWAAVGLAVFVIASLLTHWATDALWRADRGAKRRWRFRLRGRGRR
jgi:hypothetical protein